MLSVFPFSEMRYILFPPTSFMLDITVVMTRGSHMFTRNTCAPRVALLLAGQCRGLYLWPYDEREEFHHRATPEPFTCILTSSHHCLVWEPHSAVLGVLQEPETI